MLKLVWNIRFQKGYLLFMKNGYIYGYSSEIYLNPYMYSQLDSRRTNVGRSWLRYKDKLKSNLSAVNIPHNTFEQVALERKEWRSMCHNGIKLFETNRINRLREARVRTKASANVPATLSRNPHSCTICGLVCKSLAGLKCHTRHKHPN